MKPAVVLVGWGFWPSVENYIVDASILDSMPFGVSGHKVKHDASFGVCRGDHWSLPSFGVVVSITHVISSF